MDPIIPMNGHISATRHSDHSRLTDRLTDRKLELQISAIPIISAIFCLSVLSFLSHSRTFFSQVYVCPHFTHSTYVYLIMSIPLRWRWIKMTIEIQIESGVLVYVKCAVWLVLSSTCHFLTDYSLQSVDKDQQESRAVAEKLRDAAVNFDTYEAYSGIAWSSLW